MMERDKLVRLDSHLLPASAVETQLTITKLLLDVDSSRLIPFKNGRMWGYADDFGNVIIDCVFEDADFFVNQMARVQLNGSFGFIDRSGEFLIEPVYEEATPFVSMNLAFVRVSGKWRIIDRDGRFFNDEVYDYIEDGYADFISMNIGGYQVDSPSPAAIINGGKWGFMSKIHHSFIECRYEELNFPTEGLFLARDNETYYGYIDDSGGVVIDFIYRKAKSFRCGFASVGKYSLGKDGRWMDTWGVIDRFGETVLPSEYEECIVVNAWLFAVKLGGKWGIVNKAGQVVYPFTFSRVVKSKKSDKFFEVAIGRSVSVLCAESGKVFPKYFDEIGFTENGFFGVKEGNLWGVASIDTGEVLIPVMYQAVNTFGGGYIKVSERGRWGVVDQTGKFLILPKYDMLGELSEGLVAARLNEKWGFIDIKESVIVSFLYDSASEFREGVAIVTKDKLYGYVDNVGREVLPCEYRYLWAFRKGLGTVSLSGGYSVYVNKHGVKFWK